jgi:hypothetical protein
MQEASAHPGGPAAALQAELPHAGQTRESGHGAAATATGSVARSA